MWRTEEYLCMLPTVPLVWKFPHLNKAVDMHHKRLGSADDKLIHAGYGMGSENMQQEAEHQVQTFLIQAQLSL